MSRSKLSIGHRQLNDALDNDVDNWAKFEKIKHLKAAKCPLRKFLPEIDTVLCPYSSAKSGLIDAIATLGDDALKTVALYKFEHLRRRPIRDL
jgi:hypothetical protein